MAQSVICTLFEEEFQIIRIKKRYCFSFFKYTRFLRITTISSISNIIVLSPTWSWINLQRTQPSWGLHRLLHYSRKTSSPLQMIWWFFRRHFGKGTTRPRASFDILFCPPSSCSHRTAWVDDPYSNRSVFSCGSSAVTIPSDRLYNPGSVSF